MADMKLDITTPRGDGTNVGSCNMEEGGFDTRRSLSESEDEYYYNDEGPLIEDDDFENERKSCVNQDGTRTVDPIFREIKDSIARKQSDAKSSSSTRSESSDLTTQVKISDQYLTIPYGIQPRATYEHGKRSTDIMGVTYNGRMRQFIILDSKGITTWKRDAVKNRVNRAMSYPKYEYGLITYMVYAKKYNCYFVLGKDFSLKVYNRDFFETCSVSADLRSVLFMLFNPVRDELITGGVGGTKVWRFHQQPGRGIAELKPLANYGLTLKYELPNVGGSWVKRVELDHHLEHLYCCSDTDLHVYNLTGKLLFKYERAHMMSITGCRYSKNASVLVTSSVDCEVKVWSLMGGLVHTFRGHSRAVTNLILHPATSSIIITCSLDGSVRMWSLDTMDTLYSLVVSADGVLWMGLTDDNMLFLSTPRVLTLWNLNYSHQFWAMARSRITSMSLAGCKEKTTRVMAISEDSSVRVIARSNSKNLSTVLPPPSISPLHRVMNVCYSREFSVIFMLINPHEIWLYTTRTDPSCRIAAWNVLDLQYSFVEAKQNGNEEGGPSSVSWNKPVPTHRATEKGHGNEALSNCCCISVLNSTAMVWKDEGFCCPIRDSYLLLGLEDGRILFMDPVKKGHKYFEFKTGKDPVLDIHHDSPNKGLITLYKLKDRMMLHIWGLPDLEMQHEIYLSLDLMDYARMGYTFVTGYESGCVIFSTLEHTTDPGIHKGKMLPAYEEVVETSQKPDHLAPVINVDVCDTMKIFATCSKDGAIKIWQENQILLTEIMLDESLSSACFLDNRGDLIVGFQKHVFYIDHSKVCPQLTFPESDIESFDKESYVCEDPYVMYEGVTPNPDPVTLENYLVPFDIEFSEDFLEGKVNLEPEPVQKEESDSESQVSMASTDIYNSPDSTPRRRLSLVDLTLGSRVTKHDLLKHMKKTMDHLQEKAYRKKRRHQIRQHGQEEVDAAEPLHDGLHDGLEGEDTENEEEIQFSFPKFGVSPGSTPASTPHTTPEHSSGEEEKEVDVTQDSADVPVKVEIKVKEEVVEQDEIKKFLQAEKEKEKKVESKSPRAIQVKKPKFGLGGITVDASSLMRDTKKPQRMVKRGGGAIVEQSHHAYDSDSDAEERRQARKERAVKKKMMTPSQRKPLIKPKKSEGRDMDLNQEPPSMMQALESKEKKLKVTDTPKAQKALNEAESKIESEHKERMTEENVSQKGKRRMSKDEDEVRDSKTPVVVPDLPVVPSLPIVPDETSEKTPAKPKQSAADSKAALIKKLGSRSAIDFHSTATKSGVSEGDSGQGTCTQTEVTDTVQQTGRMSAASVTSNEAQAAFRIGLLSKESEDPATPPPQLGREALHSPTMSEVTLATPRDVTTPTPIATPDICSAPSRPASQAMSMEPPPSRISQSAIPEMLEGGVDTDVATNEDQDDITDMDMDLSEIHRSVSPDSGLLDSDFISVSRQGLRSAERHLRQEAGLKEEGDYITEDGTSAVQSQLRQRPMTSSAALEATFADQPELLNALKYFRRRPHTAHKRFTTEDLQTCFDTSLKNYRRLARTDLTSDKLYKNEDLNFTEDWHERQIERHMLVRMQKELRSQNAQKRRQIIELRKMDNLKQRIMAEQNYGSQTPAIQVSMTQRRAITVHGTRPSQPAPTPISSRPHTAIGGSHHGSQMALNLHGHMAMTLEQRARQQEIEGTLRSRAYLGMEKAFRCRMREADGQSDMMEDWTYQVDSAPCSPRRDVWTIDPRNPQAVRPKSSKSIPSKCHRYVLVSKPKPKLSHPLPTPLEEQLLALRFPEQGERVMRRYEGLMYRPPRRPVYGINYSPYQHQLYG